MKPYLIRAVYEWLVDNNFTPYLLADATRAEVPESAVIDGLVTLNLRPAAVEAMSLGNEVITFNARFKGVSQTITVPVASVLAIYAKENGQGLRFDAPIPVGANEYIAVASENIDVVKTPPRGKLRVVK
jgi:stringent starvation protein B